MPLFSYVAERGLYLIRESRRKAIEACMTQPYNMTLTNKGLLEMLGKSAALVGIALIVLNGMGCRKGATANADHIAIRPSADAIAEADQYYAQRTDLTQGRHEIVRRRHVESDQLFRKGNQGWTKQCSPASAPRASLCRSAS